jgi:hypothetical protein
MSNVDLYYVEIPGFPRANSNFSFRFSRMGAKDNRPYEELKLMEKRIYEQPKLDRLKLEFLSSKEKEMYHNYKMQELKDKATSNYIDTKIIGNKSLKRIWVKAISKTYDWSFNTFMVGIKSNKKHPLNGQIDVLLMIQSFI